MLNEISWEQFQEWLAYEVVEPFGELRADWQAASVCAAVANSSAIISGSRKRFKVSDFLLEFDEQVKAIPGQGPAQNWQRHKMIAKMFAAIANKAEAKRLAREEKDKQRRATRKYPERKRRVKPVEQPVDDTPKKPTREQIEAVRAALQRKR